VELRLDLKLSQQSVREERIINFEVGVELVQITFSLFQFRAISSFHLGAFSILAPFEILDPRLPFFRLP
jgi:hypothetical protein